jgi:hypothetical protein
MNLKYFKVKIFTVAFISLVTLFISGCKKKQSADNDNNYELSILTDKAKSKCDEFVVLSGASNLKYLGNNDLLVCKYEIIIDKKNNGIESILNPLKEIYTNSNWTTQDIVYGDNFVTFSGTKPGKYLTVTLIIEKRKKTKVTIHSSISSSDCP